VTDQFPPEPGMRMPKGDDQPARSPSLSIFTRRESATGDASQQPSTSETATPAPPPTATTPPVAGIGRLVRVPASALWTDNAAMATWLASTPAALMDAAGVEAERFESPDGNIVLGTTKSGTPICVVCEVGPSSDEGLGVLLRIAAVQDGGVVLWLTGEAGDSHTAALSWLNRSTAPRFSMVRVTGVRIDGSASAPIFTLVVRPARATDAAEDTPAEAGTEGSNGRQRRLEDHLPEG
jgi:hypothetical protein